MAGRPILPLPLSALERCELERRAHADAPHEGERARIVLCRAAGLSQQETAERLGCSARRVATWVGRFRRMGIRGLVDKPGRGRKAESSASPAPGLKGSLKRLSETTDGAGERVRSKGADVAAWKPRDVRAVHREGMENQEVAPNKAGPRGESSGVEATVHSVARAAGVSPMTVSRVLQGHSNVRHQLRQRVFEAARSQGYRPDPHLQKLMVYLRHRRTRRLQGSICALTSADWTPGGDLYYRGVLSGARSRAAALGFAWENVPYMEMVGYPRRTVRILRNRGVEGILLPPVSHVRRLPPGKIWDDFSVIAATYSIADPGFHRVVPDQFRNIQIICRALAQRGCTRIGLVIWKGADANVQYHWSGAFAAFHYEMDRRMVPVCYRNTGGDDRMREWYQCERPDAIVAENNWELQQIAGRLGLDVSGPVAFAAISRLVFPESQAGGIDELPEQVGAKAVERLARKILHGEKGLPDHPTVTMIEGVWHDGAEE